MRRAFALASASLSSSPSRMRVSSPHRHGPSLRRWRPPRRAECVLADEGHLVLTGDHQVHIAEDLEVVEALRESLGLHDHLAGPGGRREAEPVSAFSNWSTSMRSILSSFLMRLWAKAALFFFARNLLISSSVWAMSFCCCLAACSCRAASPRATPCTCCTRPCSRARGRR